MKTAKDIENELRLKEERISFWERTHNVLTYGTIHDDEQAEAST